MGNSKACLLVFGFLLIFVILACAGEESNDNSVSEEIESSRVIRDAEADAGRRRKKARRNRKKNKGKKGKGKKGKGRGKARRRTISRHRNLKSRQQPRMLKRHLMMPRTLFRRPPAPPCPPLTWMQSRPGAPARRPPG